MLKYFKKYHADIGVIGCQFLVMAVTKLFEVFAIGLVLLTIYMIWIGSPR